jgi:peptidoglycan-N-acetylglucosamine deacetylase
MAVADTDPLASSQPLGPTKVTLTIDDFPENGDLPPGTTRQEVAQKIIETLKVNGLTNPYGFSNGNFMEYDPSEKDIFKMWLAVAHPLGNHTYDHANLNQIGVKAFLEDIAKQDDLLATFDSSPGAIKRRRVFRYPYMDEGNTLEKREAVRQYLSKNDYRIAEVTVDYFDWAWNAAFNRCTTQQDEKSIAWLKDHIGDSADRHLRGSNAVSDYLLNRRIPHILLVHINAFNAMTLGPIIKHWKGEGVQFVSLDETLADPIYKFDPKFAYEGGLTFLDQIAESRGLGIAKYDDNIYTMERLNQVCRAPPAAKH